MRSVTIGTELKTRCPDAVLGILQGKISVRPDDEAFLTLFNEKIEELSHVELSKANKREYIQSTRKAYKALGKEPNRYRSSAEAMCRRISKERGLYYINNIVDIVNYLSILTGYSMGIYDLKKIEGNIMWERAPEGTVYQGIGKDVLNIEYLPALFDEKGAFGNPTSDSTRTMVTDATEEFLLLFYTFNGGEEMDKLLPLAKELLETYADGKDFEVSILS